MGMRLFSMLMTGLPPKRPRAAETTIDLARPSKINAAQVSKKQACVNSLPGLPPARDPKGRMDSGEARLDRKKACVR
jgi:hypothetical protein